LINENLAFMVRHREALLAEQGVVRRNALTEFEMTGLAADIE